MKSLKWMLPLFLLLATTTSCKKHVFNSIKGKGSTVTEIRNVSGFNKISLDINADVIYIQDSVYYLEISAQQNLMDVITTKIDGDELEIDSKKWIRKHNGIKITVHSPNLRGIDIKGSGNVESSSNITTSKLELEISGSGGIKLASVHASELEADISGSGNMHIFGGAVTNQKLKISGSGNMEMEQVEANQSDAKISGSGSITVWVLNQLNAEISGSGNIRYKGSPSVNTKISGSGSVIHI